MARSSSVRSALFFSHFVGPNGDWRSNFTLSPTSTAFTNWPAGALAKAEGAPVSSTFEIPKGVFENVHFFWGDERCVPPEDPESNFSIAKKFLIEPLRIPEAQVHRIRGEEDPATAARAAEEESRRILPCR